MKRILYFLIFLIVLVVGGGLAAFYLTPSSTIAGIAQDQVRESTGRELTISGEIERTLFPTLGVKTGAVTLSNADWAGDEPMVAAESISVGVNFLSLLGGATHVEELRLIQPRIRLERNAQGVANWEFAGSEDAGDAETGRDGGGHGGSGGGGGAISLGEAVIEDGSFSFIDRVEGQEIVLTDINATAGLPALDAPFKLDGSAVWNGQTVTLAGLVDSPAKAQAGETVTSDFSLTAPGLDGAYKGDVTPPQGDGAPQATGTLSLNLSADRQQTAWLRQSFPPDLDGLGAVRVAGALSATEAGLDVDLDGGADFNGRDAALKLTAKGGGDWATGGPIALSLNATSPDLLDASFDGTATAGEDAGSIKGALSFASPRIRDLADWAGAGPIDAPAGTFETVSIQTEIDASPARFALTNADIAISDTTIKGDIVADLTGDRPDVDIDVTTGALDLRPFMVGDGGASGDAQTAAGAAGGGTAQGWSKDPIDVSALRLANARFSVLADSVTTPTVKLGKTLILGQLQDGAATVSFKELSLYGGGAQGDLGLDGSSDEAAVDIDMVIDKVQLRPLLTDLANFSSLDGLALVEMDVTGRGASLDAIMRSLNGDGRIDFADGAIYGINIPAMMRNLTGSFSGESQKTDFASLTGSFTIRNGVADNPDLSLIGPLLRMTGAGKIDIGNQTLDYRLEPKAVASLEGQGGATDLGGLSFPVIVRGPWTNLSYQPDLQGGIDGLLQDPEGALKAIEGLGDGLGDGLGQGGVEGVLEGLTGQGGGDGGGDGGSPLEGVLQGLGGSGGGDQAQEPQENGGDAPAIPDPGKALKGLFGN